MTDIFSPLVLPHGPAMPNRLMLAPLTNMQSHPDGTLSDAEFHWLTLRAQGGFGLTMTCAAHVQRQGNAFAGQLGIWSDDHLPGLTRLAAAINAAGSLSSVQLHHGGRRAMPDLIGGQPVCAWDDPETDARALTTPEVEQVIADFVAAGLRAERAGFHGVELHGAHGYLLGQFLDSENNHRTDGYGGDYEGRTRVLKTIIERLRSQAGPDFQIGVRLSPERFGIDLADARRLAQDLMTGGLIDYLDMSLWDWRKTPEDPRFADRPLIDWFTDLPRGDARLGVAGKIMTGADVRACLRSGVDYVLIGRAAILHHDFPRKLAAYPDFLPAARPVTRAHLRQEGLSEPFIDYMATWKGFVAEEAEAA